MITDSRTPIVRRDTAPRPGTGALRVSIPTWRGPDADARPVLKGISELLVALDLAQGGDAKLVAVQESAIADITSKAPATDGVRRFYDWALACVKKGGTAAAVAAITAASNGLLHDADALVHAVGN